MKATKFKITLFEKGGRYSVAPDRTSIKTAERIRDSGISINRMIENHNVSGSTYFFQLTEEECEKAGIGVDRREEYCVRYTPEENPEYYKYSELTWERFFEMMK